MGCLVIVYPLLLKFIYENKAVYNNNTKHVTSTCSENVLKMAERSQYMW
jgi:hypothetical protein